MLKIIFSDIDGTLAHYPKHFSTFGEILSEDIENATAVYRDKGSGQKRKCRVLASLTGGNAYISEKTIELVKKIREKKVLFALVTGARKSTFMQRLPLLPESDIGIAENGGRIYENGKLDIEWTKKFFEVTGDIETTKQPENRKGLLWDQFRKMKQDNWFVDAREYYANFRVNITKSEGKTEEDFKNLVKTLPKEITTAFNLGMADFFPTVTGKGNAVIHIMQKYGIKKEESVCLMDDDNDLPMAKAVGTVMLPGITNQSVSTALKKHPDWICAKAKGILGTEELLKKILNA